MTCPDFPVNDLGQPGIDTAASREWSDTGATVRSGAAAGISATGDAYPAAVSSPQAAPIRACR
jgi:hypothetical protein